MGKDTSLLRAKEKIRDRSLFIAWGDGGGENFRGNYLIFRGTKRGKSLYWNMLDKLSLSFVASFLLLAGNSRFCGSQNLFFHQWKTSIFAIFGEEACKRTVGN